MARRGEGDVGADEFPAPVQVAGAGPVELEDAVGTALRSLEGGLGLVVDAAVGDPRGRRPAATPGTGERGIGLGQEALRRRPGTAGQLIEYLTIEDILELIEDLRVGPARDIGLLESAAHRPMASAFGQDAYPDRDTKAAVLLESLVGNHALVHGNKRIGWLSTVVFHVLNGIRLDVPDDDAYDLVIAVASGDLEYPAVAEQLARWRVTATH